MILAYDRIERIGNDRARIAREWQLAVAKEPVMPESIVRHSATRWHRIKREAGVTVIETWRLVESERRVA